jgi:hypothetical protein
MRAMAAVGLLALSSAGCAELQSFDLGALLPTDGPASESTVADGLREALTIGTERASSELSVPGGFSSDPRIRIGLPKQFDGVASSLRQFGLAGPLDSLVATMNTAAERAAGEAVPVFADAIRAMTLADAFAILAGPDDAATQYFREYTAVPLRQRFEPVVDASIRSVGLYDRYRDFVSSYEALPIQKPKAPDLADYVTTRTLDGLFTVLADEERAIREDPAARTTALLRKVFGGPRTP